MSTCRRSPRAPLPGTAFASSRSSAASARSAGIPTGAGSCAGLSFSTTPDDIAQAALEGVCYRFADVLEALGEVEEVVVTGGALLASPAWVQILADVLGRRLEVSGVAEGSARGAALVALERLGHPLPAAPVSHVVEPRLDRHEAHREALAEQRALIALRADA